MLTFFGMILGTIFFIIVMIVYGIMRLCGYNPDKSQDEKITKAILADNKRENDIYAEFGDYHEYKEEHTSKYVDFSDKKIQSEMVSAATQEQVEYTVTYTKERGELLGSPQSLVHHSETEKRIGQSASKPILIYWKVQRLRLK